MSRNGSGTYTLPAGNPVVTGTTISSTWANNTLTDIATALTGSLAADGQTTATGNLQMGNNRITGLADGLASTDAATVNQIPSGATFLLKASNLSDVANATTARGNLTAAKSGANSDITSITGLTTPLTVAQGGIGAATLTANNVLLGNGTSAPQTVAPSTSGNVLVSNGTTWVSSTLPTGSVLQVVNFTYNTQISTSSTSYVSTPITASITPKSVSNKILVLVSLNGVTTTAVGATITAVYRNGSLSAYIDANAGYGTYATYANPNISYLDSPSSTSAQTYTVYWKSYNGNTGYINAYSGTAGTTSCSITLMEIAG